MKQSTYKHHFPHAKVTTSIEVATTIVVLFSTTVSAESTMDHHTMHRAASSQVSTQEKAAINPSDQMSKGNSGQTDEYATHIDHSAHMAMMHAQAGYERTVEHYTIPDMQLRDANDEEVALRSLLTKEQPVILNFIFTSCTTVCPILSATLAQASSKLHSDTIAPMMVSISIDPQYDTPTRLREYAKRYNANDNWHFLTGELEQTVALQRAFAAYYGNKLNHKPVNFLRKGPDTPWVRLEGFTTSAELVEEYRALLGESS